MEVEAAAAAYGFLTGRHQPYGNPHHHPAGDDDLWEYFPCPFCYIDVEVPLLFNHLQEEHCFDMKNAVCPMCADNLGEDKITHFRIQHSHLLKRRKSSKPSFWPTTTSSGADKEAYEMSSYFMDVQAPDCAADPLLSQFICSIASIDANSAGEVKESDVAPISDNQRSNQCLSNDASEQELEERLQRIEFLKQMLMSTIF